MPRVALPSWNLRLLPARLPGSGWLSAPRRPTALWRRLHRPPHPLPPPHPFLLCSPGEARPAPERFQLGVWLPQRREADGRLFLDGAAECPAPNEVFFLGILVGFLFFFNACIGNFIKP